MVAVRNARTAATPADVRVGDRRRSTGWCSRRRDESSAHGVAGGLRPADEAGRRGRVAERRLVPAPRAVRLALAVGVQVAPERPPVVERPAGRRGGRCRGGAMVGAWSASWWARSWWTRSWSRRGGARGRRGAAHRERHPRCDGLRCARRCRPPSPPRRSCAFGSVLDSVHVVDVAPGDASTASNCRNVEPKLPSSCRYCCVAWFRTFTRTRFTPAAAVAVPRERHRRAHRRRWATGW